MHNLTDISEKVGGLIGRMDALVESYAEHRGENRVDHAAVMAAVKDVSLKMVTKADKKEIEEIQTDHRLNTLFRKAAVWIIMIAAASFITNALGGFAMIAKAAGV